MKDPELNLDLVVLGLVYDIEVEGSSARATISLTTPMCPAAGQILDDAKAAIASVEGVDDAQVELTFDPALDPGADQPADPLGAGHLTAVAAQLATSARPFAPAGGSGRGLHR